MKPIPGFPDYSITQDGKVWSKSRRDRFNRPVLGKWLKPQNSKDGYLHVSLCKKGYKYIRRIHRLVLDTYIGFRPLGKVSRHLNGNPKDNRLENLVWGTQSENIKDSVKHKTHVDNRGEKHGMSKLTDQEVRQIIYIHRTGVLSQRKIGKLFDVCNQTINFIVNQKTWQHLWRNTTLI